jgi:hypothetical protein
MYAAKYYGDNMIASGQLTPDVRKQNYQFAVQQIQKEGQSGMLDQWNPGNRVTNSAIIGAMNKLSTGQQLVQPTPRATSIDDHAAMGHPRLVPPQQPQAAPQQQPPQPPQQGDQNGQPS